MHWEPSGQDFLSPALTEAGAVGRVLPPAQFAPWPARYLPGIERRAPAGLLCPPVDHWLATFGASRWRARGAAGRGPAGRPGRAAP